jgi:hypothetical protein
MEAYNARYEFLGIAFGGVHANFANCSVSIPDSRIRPYFGDVKEGGTVLDKRHCGIDVVASTTMRAPMLKLSLPPQTVSAYVDDCTRTLTDPEEAGGMDYVSLDLYVQFWTSRGAKSGVRLGNAIVWQDGTTTAIPAENDRWSLRDYNQE